MRRFIYSVAVLLLAATPGETVSELEANGYYIESGASATEEVVSDAVFEGRADGGRLYIVVLSVEPPGGATTFSDSVLDELGSGYVVTVAPETVGFAGDGSEWSEAEMNSAIDASLEGATDDDVVSLFIADLTGTVPSLPFGDSDTPTETGGSGIPFWIIALLIGGAVIVFWVTRARSNRNLAKRRSAELERVRDMARAKLDEIANDIIEMEGEIELADNEDARAHYLRASSTYAEAADRTKTAQNPQQMMEVVKDLDAAIWELDAAEAILDGKPIPEKPKPPEPPVATREETPKPPPAPDFDRRPQRQSSYAGPDLMSAVMAILAMSGRRGGWGGMPGGFGGPVRTGRTGRGRISGGGFRGGGFGRMRGGGRRR